MFFPGEPDVTELGRKDTTHAPTVPSTSPQDWRRRQLVVDARYQLRAGVLVGLVALVLLVLLNAALIVPHRAATTGSPSLLHGQDQSAFVLVLLGSAVFLGGVIAIGVLESHRTAGAAYAIRRAVEALREGEPEIRIRLRKGDHLQDLARAVNQLAETIDGERAHRA